MIQVPSPPHQTQSQEPPNVGEEVDEAVELPPLVPDEVELLEVDVHQGEVFGHVAVVGVLGVTGCGRKKKF